MYLAHRPVITVNKICKTYDVLRSKCTGTILVSTVYIYPFKMTSTWRYTLVCLDGVMDISTAD